ncbi:MAG: beta/gamma crystallin-related protein [Nostoc sp.]|uniref:beta/gamma crystallin-related protein n=1 Tax=Nostoc sp. TaxID=1180 RepID=UPI002FF74022
MSNINNHGADMNNQTLAQLSLSAVKELNDEVAATCSGGVHYKGSNDPDVIFYIDSNARGRSLNLNASTGDGDPNIGLDNEGNNNGFNDQVSSIRIIHGSWNFFDDSNFKGQSTGVLRPGFLYNLGANNDAITSAFRVAA